MVKVSRIEGSPEGYPITPQSAPDRMANTYAALPATISGENNNQEVLGDGFVKTVVKNKKETTTQDTQIKSKEISNQTGLNPFVATETSGANNPNSFVAQQLISQATKLIEQQKYNEALEFFEKAIELDPENVRGYVGTACIYSIQGNNEKAMEFYTRAEEINPDSSFIYAGKAGIKAQNGDTQGAMDDYSRAIELNNKRKETKSYNYGAYLGRGMLKEKGNDLEGAISDYQRSLELNPNDTENRMKLGILKERISDFKGAISEYSRVIEDDPDNVKAYTSRAESHLAMKNNKSALEDARKAVSLDPNGVSSNSTLGDILQRTGNFDESIEVYTTAISNADKKLNNNKDDSLKSEEILKEKLIALEGRAFSKQFNNDIKGCIDDFSEAISLSKDNERISKLYQFRGEAYTALGDYDSAIADLEQAKKYQSLCDKPITPNESQYAANTANSDNKDSLTADATYYNDNLQRQIDTLKRMKEFDFTKIPNGKIDEVHQGGIGDCYFLSDLATNPDLMKLSNCLNWNDDGSASVKLHTVTFNKETEEYEISKEPQIFNISKEELEQQAFKLKRDDGTSIGVTINPLQDIDLKAMEIAYFKAADFRFETINGGNLENTTSLLFGGNKLPDGRRVIQEFFNGISKEDAIKIINKSYSAALKRQTGNLNGYNILGGHAYMVNGYDEKTDTVSISNPHGENRSSDNDNIIIPFDEFKKHFSVEYLAKVEL